MKQFKLLIFFTALAVSVSAKPGDPPNDPLSTWENVPEIINSITDKDYREPLNQLHQLTLIKLGYPQVSQGLSENEHRLYMIQTGERWREWWASTGVDIAEARKLGVKTDFKAFKIAWDFLDGKVEKPETILPVWIPETWTLCITDLPEKESMLEWAAKEKAATNPKMDWKMRCSDFSTDLKENVINFTQQELKQTLAEIKKIESRLTKESKKPSIPTSKDTSQ